MLGGFEGEDAAEAEVEAQGESLLRLRGVAGETVHDAWPCPVFAQDRHGVVPGFAGVDGDGQIEVAGEFELLDEDFALDFARREIVVVIEADFAERDNFRVRGQGAEVVVGLRRDFGGIVRVDADGGVDLRVAVGEADGAVDFGRAVAGADGENARDSGCGGALENGVEVVGEALVVEMAVRIDEHRYFRRAPTGTSSRKPARMGLPPSSDAATIMPFDSMPRSLRGCRLATMTTLRPTIFSGS